MSAIAGDLIALDDPRWEDVLQRVRHDVYHTVPYVRLEAQRLGGDAMAFLVDDDGCTFLVPVVVRRVEDERHATFDAISPYGYPGVLLSDEAKKRDGFVAGCIAALRVGLRERGICSAFLRMNPILNDDLADILGDRGLTANGMTVSIDVTQPPDRLWASMRKGHTNAVNKARRFGYEMSIGPATQGFDRFLPVYSESLVRLRAASRYHFSEQYLREIASFPNSYVAVALLGDEVAGAYLYFSHDGIVQMHLGGPAAAFMKPSASNLMIYEVAMWAHERGDDVVHLGGGLGGSSDDSLFTFKSGFSPSRHRYDTMRLVTDHDTYNRLVSARAATLGVSRNDLYSTGFFPAYRAL
jgi:hypothetical protein